ncbi:23S rRNA (uracil(1939)-C(5))-methyltransferase RlmD [bacterium]|nr:23S rRNA (uracil(1939)-C(5))-methyltransferase RlmD [bacterium]MCP5461987.1 23S rRNA (uracil(1939)-C(5))-methyltransferase RlmD [bacterium]
MTQHDQGFQEIEITDIAFPNNWGVGRIDKKVVFVPDGIIGDKLLIQQVRGRKKYTFGKIHQIITPSPYRRIAPCKHNAVCGGCIMQELDYTQQLAIKRNYLVQTFHKEGISAMDKIQCVPIIKSPDEWFYRNKMEFTFGKENGEIHLGLMKRTLPFENFSGTVNNLEHCLIFSDVVETLFPIAIDFVKRYQLEPFDLMTKEGFVRSLVVREGKNTGDLMVIFVTTRGDLPQIQELYDSIREKIPALKSFYWIENNRISNVFDAEKVLQVYGNEYIEEKIHDKRFRLYPQTFFQTNTHGAEELHTKIVEAAALTGNERVLGLFCGAGAIEISLANHAKEVIGIDINPVNIANAHENCRINGITNCAFHEGDAGDLLNSLPLAGMDVVVIDPPRSGLSNKTVKRIKRLQARRIVYVSCSPPTLARDVKSFEHDGYVLESIAAFDFFPHTGHLETLACLAKQ